MALKAFSLLFKFQMTPRSLQTSLYIWGNHHISNKKGFQDLLHHFIAKHTITLYSPDFHIDPVLDLEAIEKLELNVRPWPSILVIIFGDVNLLKPESLPSILKHFEKIYKSFSFKPNYKLVTCGIIPPRIIPAQFGLCLDQFNYNLRKLQQSKGGTYISLVDQFDFDDYENFSTLNYRGNLKLAKLITSTLATIERE